jgi:hypothetical protein
MNHLRLTKLTERKIKEYFNELDHETWQHLFYMIDTLEDMENIEKANRWIGFIHGTLVALTDCTVEELKDMCREKNK